MIQKVFILMDSISKLESFVYITFRIVGGGQGFPKLLGREIAQNHHILTKCPKSAYFGEYYELL